jgi:hypothetical protein
MSMPLPLEVDELTPAFMSWALDTEVATVAVLDRHSGTTGRARLALSGARDVPPTVFVKLAPFGESQRKFVNNVGMGVTEARFYRDIAAETGLRVPKVWFADHEGDDRYIMVLEDLEAAGCRFPGPDDDDIEFRARDIVAELAPFHARYWQSERFAGDGDLAWIAPKGTASGDGGAPLVQMALDNLADRLPDGFRPLAELYVARAPDVLALYRDGARTLVHGDDHMGNLFVDGTRTGFLDWAVISYAPGMRDVAYVMCNSVPAEIRRAIERELVADYCARLASLGVTLDANEAWDQYRLFAVYSWVAAACTAAMGSKWQPEHIGLGGTARATVAAVDLDCLGLLESRLG